MRPSTMSDCLKRGLVIKVTWSEEPHEILSGAERSVHQRNILRSDETKSGFFRPGVNPTVIRKSMCTMKHGGDSITLALCRFQGKVEAG